MAALNGCVAIVTGASSGIGEATARDLAGRGATVIAAARRTDRLAALAASVSNVHAVECDVTDVASVQRMVDGAVDRFGRIDILVNNAGIGLTGPATQIALEEWRTMVDVNVMGVLNCTHIALNHLINAATGPRGVADIVNISSVAGRKALPGSSVYAATKFAVNAFSDGLRQELASKHVRVSIVAPGFTKSEFIEHIRPDLLAKIRPSLEAMPAMTAEEIAETITFCVTRPAGVSVSDLLVRPTEQER
ncbi:MAG: SDR family oxidoreductase [Actinobacteria bacterium]|nr:SDR family oxidoreductase [Actinomycetota bacterium]NBP54276.1 SDR family oxidoreductase [Actinomycetota bacterium]